MRGQLIIKSEEPIQIKTDQKNNDKMITGTVVLNSDAILSVPVDNVVINTTKVTLNSPVKNLMAKQAVTIIMDENIQQDINKRHGVIVTVNNSQGKEITDNFTVKEVLDDSEITWYLGVAQNYLKHSNFGDQHGAYSVSAKNNLVTTLKEVKEELIEAQEEYKDANSDTKSLQQKIDKATVKLEKSIEDLKSSRVYVILSDLYASLDKANLALYTVTQDKQQNQFSREEVEKLKEIVKGTENLLYGSANYTKETIDNQTVLLDTQVETVKESWVGNVDENPFNVATVSLQIIGKGITDNNGTTNIYEILENGGHGSGSEIIATSHLINGGIQFDIRTTKVAPIEVIIQTNNHLVISDFTLEEINSGEVKIIELDESYVPLGLEVEGLNEKEIPKHQQVTMIFTSKDGRSRRMAHLSLGTKIPSGSYDFRFNYEADDVLYSLNKTNTEINQKNPNITFTDKEIAKVGFELEGQYTDNFTLSYISIYSDLNEVLSDIFSNKEYNQFIINQDEYYNIQTVYLFEKDLKQWQVYYNTGTVTIDTDKVYNYSDELRVVNQLSNAKTTLDSIIGYGVSIYDKYDNNVGIMAQGEGTWFTVVDATVVIHKDDKEYSKTLPMYQISQTSIKDIVGDANLSGEVTLEIHIDNPPFDIAPYIEKIDIVKPANN